MSDPRLELDGERVRARLIPERGTNGGYSLVIEGTTQSHVNPRDPHDLQLEYARLVVAIVDGCRAHGEPIRALHLGAGGLTIPRYLGATRPGSAQHVVELHRELLEFVLDVLPLEEGTELTVEYDDARVAVERAARSAGGYDVAVVDVFSGSVAPRHLSTAEFFTSLGELLASDGIIIVNTLATAGADTGREIAATLASVRAEVMALVSPAVLDGTSLGNIVFSASSTPLPLEEILRTANEGPRPVIALEGASFAAFVDGAAVRHDADASD
jgi:spermidine synthase